MTILAEHPWLILFYIASVCLQLAVTLLPRIAVLGWGSALLHGIAVVALFITGCHEPLTTESSRKIITA